MTMALWALCKLMNNGQHPAAQPAWEQEGDPGQSNGFELGSPVKDKALDSYILHVYWKQNKKHTSKQREMSYGRAWEYRQEAVV